MINNRSGLPYKPSAIRSYEAALRNRLLPEFGRLRLSELRPVDILDFADRLKLEGFSPSTVRNMLMPLRAIYSRAISRGEVAINPTLGLALPAVRTEKDRIAPPSEAAGLLAALPKEDRPLWACALYAGLRRGELQALRWSDVDLARGVIRVERSWDAHEGPTEPKSRAGRRIVPIPAVLRDYLDEHLPRAKSADALVFGATPARPFTPSHVRRRANAAWKKAGLASITLHEARHTYASYMIAAGVNAKALTTYMGHSSIQISFDRYGHLMPGNEDEAAAHLDEYLARGDTAARLIQLDQ